MRIIARLDVQPPFVVKPIQFEGLRKLGSPKDFATKYYLEGVDEIMYIDIVSSLYKQSPNIGMIKESSDKIFIPFAAGGGITTIEECIGLMNSGVDKIIINTYGVYNPDFIKLASELLGSQSVVVHIEAKKHKDWWECYTDRGRISSGVDVISWAKRAENLGAGEIVISSVDMDGLKSGFDIQLIKLVCEAVNIPVVAASGAGDLSHIEQLLDVIVPSGIALGSSLHYQNLDISLIRQLKERRGL